MREAVILAHGQIGRYGIPMIQQDVTVIFEGIIINI